METLINKKLCRSVLLEEAQAKWPGKFRSVGSDVIEFLDAMVRVEISHFVRSHPTLGHRLSTGVRKNK